MYYAIEKENDIYLIVDKKLNLIYNMQYKELKTLSTLGVEITYTDTHYNHTYLPKSKPRGIKFLYASSGSNIKTDGLTCIPKTTTVYRDNTLGSVITRSFELRFPFMVTNTYYPMLVINNILSLISPNTYTVIDRLVSMPSLKICDISISIIGNYIIIEDENTLVLVDIDKLNDALKAYKYNSFYSSVHNLSMSSGFGLLRDIKTLVVEQNVVLTLDYVKVRADSLVLKPNSRLLAYGTRKTLLVNDLTVQTDTIFTDSYVVIVKNKLTLDINLVPLYIRRKDFSVGKIELTGVLNNKQRVIKAISKAYNSTRDISDLLIAFYDYSITTLGEEPYKLYYYFDFLLEELNPTNDESRECISKFLYNRYTNIVSINDTEKLEEMTEKYNVVTRILEMLKFNSIPL